MRNRQQGIWLGESGRPAVKNKFMDNPVNPSKVYLGDGAYASFDGYNIWLTTEDGISETNRICLEPEAMQKLDEFWVAMYKSPRAQSE